MSINPYISGAITAAIYILSSRLLAKKLVGWKRVIVAFAITVFLACLIQYIFDLFA